VERDKEKTEIMKRIFKLNGGNGAQLCNVCRTIIHTGDKSDALLCPKHLKEYIYEYPTKHKEGFTDSELLKIIYDLHLGKGRFFDKLGVNTCMVIEEEIVLYHEDVLRTIRLIWERRDMYHYEWD
jgi:hypothetical protein